MRATHQWTLIAICLGVLTSTSCENQTPEPPQDRSRVAMAELLELTQQIRVEKARLSEVQQQIEAAETRARIAEGNADYYECRANAKGLEAEAQRRQAMCAKDVADHNFCLASNSRQAGQAAVGGCALGILIAALSGGTGAWALGGCTVGVGLGAATEQPCPLPTCSLEIDAITATVLTERGLSAAPRCGGYAGFNVEVSRARAQGMRIDRVVPGTYAQAASVAAGDVLIRVA